MPEAIMDGVLQTKSRNRDQRSEETRKRVKGSSQWVYSSYSFEYHICSFHYESYQNTKIPKLVVCEAGTSSYERLWVHFGLRRSEGRKGNEPFGRSWV